MKVLKVIHGYPPAYNAGSEVYSQNLCHGLAKNHRVHVFTREENPFLPDFSVREESDSLNPSVQKHLVNIPLMRQRYRYSHPEVDALFGRLVDKINPDIVHIGHLNHLSTTLVTEAKNRNIPTLYTLHDYWLMCARGQFLQRNPKAGQDPWKLCDGQEDRKCAKRCYSGYFSGIPSERLYELEYWTRWFEARTQHMKEVIKNVDLFVAPARYLLKKYKDHYGISNERLIYLDYGFNHGHLKNRARNPQDKFVFGYIGTHTPQKGIHHLLKAFGHMKTDCRLKIWGRARGEITNSLKEIIEDFSTEQKSMVSWEGEYRNENIVQDVLNHVDAIVCPSIWEENSPLVIHEAQQVRLPVVTAMIGGMAEYVHHEVNGLLFEHRNIQDLTAKLERMAQDPAFAKSLGARGYLYSKDRNVPEISEHVHQIEALYTTLINNKKGKIMEMKPGPWRITFDTNPDDCNLRCIMCEGFSPHSRVKDERLASGRPRRRMDVALIRKILEEAKGTPLKEIIPSTMGEPLVYKHFEEILEMCHEFGVKLNLTTNGTFPMKGAEEWAKLIVPVTSDVKISWNAATKETQEKIMLGTNWEKVLSNLKAFIKIRDEHEVKGGNRCRVTLQLTFLQTNVHELADIVRLGVSLGVDRIKGHHLWAHFKEIKDLSMRRDGRAIEEWNRAAHEAQQVADETLLPNGKKILLENIYPLAEDAHKNLLPEGVCPFLGQEAWVNTEGKFSPCCAPDEQRKQLGDFGNLHDQSLTDIWEGDGYTKLQRTYQNHPLCIGCNMKKSPEDMKKVA